MGKWDAANDEIYGHNIILFFSFPVMFYRGEYTQAYGNILFETADTSKFFEAKDDQIPSKVWYSLKYSLFCSTRCLTLKCMRGDPLGPNISFFAPPV